MKIILTAGIPRLKKNGAKYKSKYLQSPLFIPWGSESETFILNSIKPFKTNKNPKWFPWGYNTTFQQTSTSLLTEPAHTIKRKKSNFSHASQAECPFSREFLNAAPPNLRKVMALKLGEMEDFQSRSL